MNLEKAKDIVLKRLQTEIFVCHNAITLYIAISEHASSLNASRFRQTLGSIQRNAFDSFILSICKMYERHNKRYPNYSIPTALDILMQNVSSLAAGIQNHIKLEHFIQSYIDSTFTVTSKAHNELIPGLMMDYFSDRCPHTPPRKGYDLDLALDSLKVLRDKRIAHYEDTDISGLSKTNLDGVLSLLSFAKSFVNLVGYGFFGFSMHGVAVPDDFAPEKNDLWSEINQMIQYIEKGGQDEKQ